MFLKEVSRLHLFDQGSKNTKYCEILLKFETTVFYVILNVIYSCDAVFSASLLQSSVSHDPSEITLIR